MSYYKILKKLDSRKENLLKDLLIMPLAILFNSPLLVFALLIFSTIYSLFNPKIGYTLFTLLNPHNMEDYFFIFSVVFSVLYLFSFLVCDKEREPVNWVIRENTKKEVSKEKEIVEDIQPEKIENILDKIKRL